MRRFLKGFAKINKGGEQSQQLESTWKGVHNSLKGVSLTDALEKDKQQQCQEESAGNLLWFHENTNRSLAVTKLKDGTGDKTGAFLVRASAIKGNFVLSLFANGKAYHYHIQELCVGCYCIVEGQIFRGVDQLVDFYRKNTTALPTKLQKPRQGCAPPIECRAIGHTNLLHQCVYENATKFVIKILDHHLCPDINAKNNKGNTALHEACLAGHEHLVSLLLERNANTSMPQIDGYTPLMLSCIHNWPNIVRLLIEAGNADPQDTNIEDGNVALHAAAKHGHLDCVQMLLELKAPAWPRNNDGKTPHELAKEAGNDKCAAFIDNSKAFPAETSKEDWYHGTLTKPEAEKIIRNHGSKEGYFLVRKSSTRKHVHVLVLASQFRIFNFVIQAMDQYAFYIDDGPFFSSLEHVVEYYSKRSDGLPARLIYAVSKDGKVVKMTEKYRKAGAACAADKAGGRTALKPGPLKKRAPEPLKLEYSSLQIGCEIGEGEYGSVYKGIWTSPEKTKVPVAIKTLHVRHTSARENFLSEANVMVQLDHPCIVQLIGVCTEPSIMLVQELVPLGSMLDYMLDYPDHINISPDLYFWASQIACGMNYLEEHHFVHRDLAARNILLVSKVQVKVGDFGLSRATGSQTDDYQASVGGRWPIKWYAPECVNYGTFSSRSDVWSYGVTLWEMFTLGEQPYGEKTGAQVISLVDRGHRLKKPSNCTEEAYTIMRQCWEYEATKRPTFKQLLQQFESFIPELHMNVDGTIQSSDI